MQVLGGALDFDEKVAISTEAVRQARLRRSEPVAVRDAHEIDGAEEVLLLAKQGVEAQAPALLHALEDDLSSVGERKQPIV